VKNCSKNLIILCYAFTRLGGVTHSRGQQCFNLHRFVFIQFCSVLTFLEFSEDRTFLLWYWENGNLWHWHL